MRKEYRARDRVFKTNWVALPAQKWIPDDSWRVYIYIHVSMFMLYIHTAVTAEWDGALTTSGSAIKVLKLSKDISQRPPKDREWRASRTHGSEDNL